MAGLGRGEALAPGQRVVVGILHDGSQRFSPLPSPAIQEHFDFVSDYAFRTGLTRKKVDVSKLIDRRYVDQATKDLKLEGWWTDPKN